MHATPVISVVICTYNRCEQLASALQSLKTSCSAVNARLFEVLVVDNNSSDGTRNTVEKFGVDFPLRYVFETEQGLSNARNRALREFLGDWLLFVDDDVIVDPNWLPGYLNLIQSGVATGYIGGRILPLWEEHPPRWLHDEDLAFFSGILMKYDLGETNRPLDSHEPAPYGASLAISRSLVQAVGHFRRDLGVVGRVPARGEETEYLGRAMEQGFKGYYCGQSLCHHLVNKSRLSLRYLYRFGVQKGIAGVKMGQTGSEPNTVSILGFAIRGCFQLLKGRGDRARQCLINIGIQRGIRQASANKP